MLTKYVHRYISPFTIFLIDMFVSVMSSLVVLLLVNRITVRDLWTLQPLLLWLGSSALFSDFHIGTAYKYDHHTTYDHPRVRTFHYGIVLQGHVNGLYVRVD